MKQKKSRGLRPLEKKIIELIAGGFTDEDIAKEINLSYTTIRAYVSNLLSYSKTVNRPNLIYWAVTNGIIK